MVLTQALPETAAPALASFNFADIAAGTGYETLFGIDLEGGTVTVIPTGIDGKNGFTEITSTGTTELNFDLIYNLPRKVKGDLFITLTYDSDDNSASGTATTKVLVRPIHVTSGGTETELSAQVTTDTVVNGDREAKRTTISFASINRLFKKDEKLRMEVILDVSTGGSGATGRVYHDGANIDYTAKLFAKGNAIAPSTLLINIPYNIDI